MLGVVVRMAQTTLINYDVDSRIDGLFVAQIMSKTQAEKVLSVIQGCSRDGATDAEIAAVLDVKHTSVIARRHELIKKYPDLLYVAGKRQSSAGVLCDVWKCKNVKDVCA